MRSGDILLIQYRFDPVAWLIRIFTRCKYNHVAWAINNEYLVELKARGKRTVHISHYRNSWWYNYKLVRPKGIGFMTLRRLVHIANNEYLCYSYISAIWTFVLVRIGLLSHLFLDYIYIKKSKI